MNSTTTVHRPVTQVTVMRRAAVAEVRRPESQHELVQRVPAIVTVAQPGVKGEPGEALVEWAQKAW